MTRAEPAQLPSPPPTRLAEFDVDGQVGRLIRQSNDALQRRVMSRLEASGFGDLGFVYVRVLLAALKGPQRPGRLADRCPMTRQALNHLLIPMIKTGYMKRVSGPSGHDTRFLSLTAKGNAAAAIAVLVIDEFEQHYQSQVGPEAYEAFKHVLRLMAAEGASD